jgi:hexosaminidase
VKSLRLLVLSLLLLPCVQAAPSELATRGYTVLPQPQRVTLRSGDFKFGVGWSVTGDDVAVAALNEGLGARFKIAPLRAGAGNALSLVIAPGSVEIGDALDNDKKAIADQAYRIDAAPSAITITANAAPGLFYGVQTLLQLLKPKEGALWLPEAQIVDWPDLRLRQIYWDDAHHLDRPEVLREVVNRAAFYKLNGVVIKFDGHFQYASAPAVVEPYAISPAELQALTDYALKRHVQIMPFLDGPGHVAFLLKHPQYAKLRAFPDSNYEICTVNPDTYKFYEGLFQDLLNANKGSKYFYLSTDEPYYVGM